MVETDRVLEFWEYPGIGDLSVEAVRRLGIVLAPARSAHGGLAHASAGDRGRVARGGSAWLPGLPVRDGSSLRLGRGLGRAPGLRRRHACTGPTDTVERVDQRGAWHLEAAADGRLASAVVQCRNDALHPFRIKCGWTATLAAPAPGGGETGRDPLLDQRPLILSKRPKEVEQELAMRRVGPVTS